MGGPGGSEMRGWDVDTVSVLKRKDAFAVQLWHHAKLKIERSNLKFRAGRIRNNNGKSGNHTCPRRGH